MHMELGVGLVALTSLSYTPSKTKEIFDCHRTSLVDQLQHTKLDRPHPTRCLGRPTRPVLRK